MPVVLCSSNASATAGYAARCRDVNSTSPGRRRANSSACRSFTFTERFARGHEAGREDRGPEEPAEEVFALLGGEAGLLGLVGDELDGLEEPRAPHIAHDRNVAERLEPVPEPGFEGADVLEDVFALEDVE